jgi:hypothetical protein
MHDLSLGGPVNVGTQEDAKHSGPCYDGVYGCHKCWSLENDGKGTAMPCDYCERVTFTKVTRASDEPVMYALCECCRSIESLSNAVECAYDDGDDVAYWESKLEEKRAERDKLKGVVDEEAQAIYDKWIGGS